MAQAARKKSSKDYEAKRTTDQDEIRLWAERRGGHPAMVEGTDILRIDFDEPDDGKDEALRRVTWDQFLQVFDDRELEFLYQEHTQDGKLSRFNKLVTPGSDEEHR
jgi:hypothetical protein